jgi:hypothetical protein
MNLVCDQVQPTLGGGSCRLRVYVPEDSQDSWIVVCSELLINEGVSITHAVEEIAAEVMVVDDHPRLVLIEHHPPETTDGETVTFDLVTFDNYEVQERALYLSRWGATLGTPRWKHLDRWMGEKLVGDHV